MPGGAGKGGMGTNIVEVYINYLRKKLGPVRAGRQSVIRTVRGEGYLLGASVGPARRAGEPEESNAGESQERGGMVGAGFALGGCVADA